ncbi:phage tail assembly chaperone [Salinarimonas rosea]|uniref:phage tail assembly chaperone n=1 Tax=Salinarimonas rosea TaxID=552063 RepID=UPI00040E2228|nr:phage tail assembly chaperone [Salinarimonas rosea]
MSAPPAPASAPALPAPAFPWDEALAAALGPLGWTPDTFWRATPRELAAALSGRGLGVRDAPTRATLAALMAAHPDG